MWTGETFWVNGTSNYWNSTSYPNDFSKLLPCDECPVTVKVGSTPFTGKTDIWGNYSVQVNAPATAGNYKVNVTVSNATANRNVPCKALEHDITVNSHWMNLSLEMNATTALPAQPLWVNGTVLRDGSPAAAGLEVNISVVGGNYWLANTAAGGLYSVQITTPNTPGTYTVNATAEYDAYGLEAWNETDLSVVAVPVPDLVVTGPNIKAIGILAEGQNLTLNVTVLNSGIANAPNAMINITLDGALLNSTVRSIAIGANTTVSLKWTATAGLHRLNASADPMDAIDESSETNNAAEIIFTVQLDNDRDGIGDPTDPDDDNDGYNDTNDAFPFDPDEWLDTDGDGTGNNADTDDDGDGVPDTTDAFPLDPDETADFDGDDIGDNADTDDDADGIPDTEDLYPLDTDNDGLNNDVDTDDDGDGILDADDEYPLVPNVTDSEGGMSMGMIAGIVIAIIIVVIILAYVFVIRPKKQ